MRFETSAGNAISARQAWHDAFVSGIRAIDYAELANGAGVQFTAKGSDNCTMDHCDKGKIQQVIFKLKTENKRAWAWGMFAYAPDGAENKNTLVNVLMPFCLWAVTEEDFNPFQIPFYGTLAICAMHDAAVEDCTGSRVRRKAADMASLLWGGPIIAACNHGKAPGQRRCILKCKNCRALMAEKTKEYETAVRPKFFAMKQALRDLSAVCLPPVASLVHTIIAKQNGDHAAIEDLQCAVRPSAINI